MGMIVDSKGNISFTPDDIPVEIPAEEFVTPNANPVELLEAESSTEPIQSEPIQAEPVLKTVETRIFNNYQEYTVEDLGILFYNREKSRCSDADDESLIRMLKEQSIMIEMCRGRERAIVDEINTRKTKRFRKDRDSLITDANWKPQTRIQKTAVEEMEIAAQKMKSKRQSDIEKLASALGCDFSEAEALYTKKGGK